MNNQFQNQLTGLEQGDHLCSPARSLERQQTEEVLRQQVTRSQILADRVIEIQEKERHHIARELHDEIGQALTAIMLNVKAALRDPTSPTAGRRLEEAVAVTEEALMRVRDLVVDLRPTILDDLGLIAALRWSVSRFAQRSGIDAQFVALEESGRGDPAVETTCYRIAQEALTNVARHAGAGRVRVELTSTGSELRLVVVDDGRGFDVASMTARAAAVTSLGVLGMQERAMLVGGRLEIFSKAGRGTEVRATLPLVRKPIGAGGELPGD